VKKSKKGSDLITFYWDVPVDGFRWIEARKFCPQPFGQSHLAPVERWLVLPHSTEKRQTRQYGPLTEEPALFRTFADTPATEEGIQHFASQYGWLGIPSLVLPQEELNLIDEQIRMAEEAGTLETLLVTSFREALEALRDPTKSKGIAGESLADWKETIWRMRFGLGLWDAIERKNVEQLRRFIVFQEGFDGGGCFVYRSSEEVSENYEMGVIDETAHDIPMEARALARPSNVLHLALIVVQELVNKQIWAHTGPALLSEPQKDRVKLNIVPKNLIGGMWLQFARSIDGEKNYRQCRQCGKWFEISLEANRPTRFYCNDGPCRAKAYRRRQEIAWEMYSEGIPTEGITQRLETDAATVQAWIAKLVRRKHNRIANR
jgi:hypothetical protein